jgi:predicted enzyme related to lactoylglutathione lyase
MAPGPANPVVHLELHTGDLQAACEFYADLFGWRPALLRACGASYLALDLANGVGGGVVECATSRPLWLPYVEVPEIASATERARRCRRAGRRRARLLAAEAMSFGRRGCL